MHILVLTVPIEESELVSDALWGLGVAAIEERSVAGDSAPATVELWTSLGADPAPVSLALEGIGFPALSGHHPGAQRWWRWEQMDDAVVTSWREHVRAHEIAPGLWILPEWRTDADRSAIPEGAQILRIDPEAAFGMGDHPTTILTMRALLERLHPGDHVADLGCGSGILGIAAALRGAARVTAVDISPAAVEATRNNAARNGTPIEVSTMSVTELVAQVRRGELEPPQLIVANILAPALIALSGAMRDLCAPQGQIIVSGILADREQQVLAAFAPWQMISRATMDGWSAVVLAAH